jgi:hypothetical protein
MTADVPGRKTSEELAAILDGMAESMPPGKRHLYRDEAAVLEAVRALEAEVARLADELEAARELAAFYKSAYETAEEAMRQVEAHAGRAP